MLLPAPWRRENAERHELRSLGRGTSVNREFELEIIVIGKNPSGKSSL
jgi:hypothetical protein